VFHGEGNFQFDTKKGNVQVVAVGNGPRRCKVVSWSDGSSISDLSVSVKCHNPDGTTGDLAFTVLYARETTDIKVADGAYLWASNSTSASYTPSANYNWNGNGGSNTVTRSGPGIYAARLPGQALTGGTVMITAYGSGSEYCKVASWGPSGADEVVNVRCFDTNGNAVDTLYSLAFARGVNAIDGSPFGSGAHVWANNATSDSYSPSSAYSYTYYSTSFNGVNTAGHIVTGDYYIKHFLFGSGTPHVTAYGTNSNYCKLYDFHNVDTGDPNTGYQRVETLCYNSGGFLTDSLYVEHLTANLGL
jgi:hypothetical protein